MNISRIDVTKAYIFLSALMVLFGSGNYVATMMLAGGPGIDQRAAAGWIIVWAILAISGIPCLILSVVQYRKAKRGPQ
jgi:hypothetical protein